MDKNNMDKDLKSKLDYIAGKFLDDTCLSQFDEHYDDELDKMKEYVYKYPDIALDVAWAKNGNIHDFDDRVAEVWDIPFE